MHSIFKCQGREEMRDEHYYDGEAPVKYKLK